jgi:hypothetical protein
MEAKNMGNQEEKKCRVVTVITEDEKKALQILARDSQRSMSSYLRYLVILEIEANLE